MKSRGIYMKILRILRMAFNSLRLNRLRSILSTLGIIVGVASLILITSFGYGAQREILSSINKIGSDAIIITPGKVSDVRRAFSSIGSTVTKPITYYDLKFLKGQIPGVVATPSLTTARATVKVGANEITVTVSGVNEDFLVALGYDLALGRGFTSTDVNSFMNYAILGSKIANDLFGTEPPLGKSITLLNTKFYIIGVLAPQGNTMFGSVDRNVYIPITKLISLTNTNSLGAIYMKPPKGMSKDVLIALVTTLLKNRHGVENFTISDMEQFANLANTATSILTTALTLIGLIALIVGGIGIMNIMLATVAERTREIGIRKAVGANSMDILLQFLFESIVITVVGGMIGIVIGVLGAQLASRLSPTAITPNSIIVGFTVSVAVGVFFGVYPAVKASKLNPVEALRYE
ncbi:MAG: multidrug ABC transporter substrate-binding protein [Caldisericum exile]|jgi:putative ABC transport system permease protein|uniref:Multidrug ABC transporter substrate-binding protein n=2 Tax=Caldisericaceae TaxID=693073 RepID=A0A2J6WF81_9BACT|nr:MAG: multidrug ABC transporter substrate-binding protein [Caldisericum exile]